MNTVKQNPQMPEGSQCPQCGTPLQPGALAGLCPACLLKQGATEDSVTDGAAKPFVPPTVAELAPLFPQLEILELIGKGGMGAVYRARQKQLDRVVALKILPPGIGEDLAFAERFAREAKALAKLNHPGIVTLYEFGQTDVEQASSLSEPVAAQADAHQTGWKPVPLFFFLMEFVDGVNLGQLLRAGRVSPREALAIVPQICDALQFAHDQGIVHRDIKPENILLDRHGRVKVADFGLAKIMGADAPLTPSLSPSDGERVAKPGVGTPVLTDAGKVMGTPNYMAPEQVEHPADVDHRADIYALGVVFYQMLTGELPGKPLQPPSRKVHVDVRLDEVVLRALEKKPELRYQQASVLKTQVETIATTPPVGSSGRESAQTEPARAPGEQSRLTSAATTNWPRIIRRALVGGFAVWFFVVAAATLVTFLLPDSYRAAARVQVEQVAPATSAEQRAFQNRYAPAAYDPNFIQTEFEVIQSEIVLAPVIRQLELEERWGQRHGRGRKLNQAEAIQLLKGWLDLRPFRGTTILEIGVFSESRDEAAESANAIADSYVRYRTEQLRAAAPRLVQATILDKAVPPLRPVRPNRPLNIVLGFAAGAVLGGLAAFAAGLLTWARRRKTSDLVTQARPDRFWRRFAVAMAVVVLALIVVPVAAILLAIALYSALAKHPAQHTAKPEGCIAHWRADGDGRDALGSHPATTIQAITFTEGVAGQGFNLDGDTSRVLVPNAPELNFGPGQDFSIEAWIKAFPTTDNSFGVTAIVDKHRTPQIDRAVGYLLGLDRGRLACMLSDSMEAEHRAGWIAPTPDLQDGRFHHVALTVQRRQTNGGKLYVDGQVALTFDPTSQAGDLTSTEPLRIGNHANPQLRCFFKGVIDEVGLYRRAVPAGEIATLYQARGTELPDKLAQPAASLPASRVQVQTSAESWSPTLIPGEKPDLEKIRQEANELMNQGRFEEALQRHLWYYNHALEYDPALSGVRLSFVLADWIELGRRYPKARQALVEIRDANARAFAEGRGYFSLFMDLKSINEHLGEDDATYALFKSIEQRDPALARQCYFAAEDLLARRGEYALCGRYMGDPQARFQPIRNALEMERANLKRMAEARERIAEDNRKRGWTNAWPLPDASAAMVKSTNDRFVNNTRQLIEILVATGRADEAASIRDQAIALLDDARLKSAISDAEEKIRPKSAPPNSGLKTPDSINATGYDGGDSKRSGGDGLLRPGTTIRAAGGKVIVDHASGRFTADQVTFGPSNTLTATGSNVTYEVRGSPRSK